MSHCATRETIRRGRHRWWLSCAAALLVILAGCSLTAAYHYADWIILWQLDHYFDLSGDQRHNLAQRLTPLLARHRHEALPQYETFLRQIRQRVGQGLTGPDIDWVYANYDRLRADLFDRFVADGGVFLASVEAHQVRTFESALQQDNAKAARLVQVPATERLNSRAQATLNWLEDWLGPLSNEQRERIREWSRSLPDMQQTWVAYQHQRQQELLTLLHQPRTPDRVARELRTILVYPDQTTSLSYQEAVHRMRAAVKTMALAVDHRLTPEQRRHGLAKLQRLIDQVHDLHAG